MTARKHRENGKDRRIIGFFPSFIYMYIIIVKTQHEIYPLKKRLSIQYSVVNYRCICTVELWNLIILHSCNFTKRPTPSRIIIKTAKVKDKERILKAAREK